jgi:hypothetical protein
VRRETITLVLDGNVSLAEFARAIGSLRTLLNSLSREVGHNVEIDWNVDDLERGSTIAAFRGTARKPNQQPHVEQVVKAYGEVGLALEKRHRIPYSSEVARAANNIAGILNGRVDAIRFETEDVDATIRAIQAVPDEGFDRPISASVGSYGAVEGRVQTLTNRGSLRFTLYDLLHDHAVSCYLEEGYEDVMRNLWGRLVTVEGFVKRDPLTGAPQTVRRITKVELMPEAGPDSWRRARGIVPIGPRGLMPEEAIRRLRDA